MNPLRPLALAVAVQVLVGVGSAAAQSVIARRVPSDTTVEVVLNGTVVGSATPDPRGDATIPFDLSARAGKEQTDAYLFVDTCDAVRRVHLVERGVLAPDPGATCVRRDISGLFLVRRVTTLVVDVERPSVLLRQGPFDPQAAAVPRAPRVAPRGLVLFGGGGLGKFREVRATTCGNLVQCEADDVGLAYTAGAEIWLTRYLAVEAGYLRPAEATAEGTGEQYSFDSTFEARVITVAGKVGVPIGPVRIYGKGGGHYHRATRETTQTFEPLDITGEDGEIIATFEGGTHVLNIQTDGWSWLYGGGVEAWISRSVGLYVEGLRTRLKGKAPDEAAAEFATDEYLTSIVFGLKVRIGR
jgi:hypothetical protein